MVYVIRYEEETQLYYVYGKDYFRIHDNLSLAEFISSSSSQTKFIIGNQVI